MADIRKSKDICTQITTVKLPPDNQEEVVNLMIERARFMATQPGFVSINLHRSKDGSHLVNYIQWTNPEKLKAAHQSPEFRKKWPQFGQLAEEIDPGLYEVVHTEAAQSYWGHHIPLVPAPDQVGVNSVGDPTVCTRPLDSRLRGNDRKIGST